MGEYTDFKKKISPVPSPVLTDEQVSPNADYNQALLKTILF